MSTRNFKLVGAVDGECTGTITLNGTQIFNGTFVGNDWADLTNTDANPMATGSMTFDDTTDVTMPVVVAVTGGTGKILVGMFEWNEAFKVNPALTPEELAYIDTPWADVPTDIQNSVTAKGGFYVQDPSLYGYGSSTETSQENRSAFTLNGSAITVATGHGIVVNVGETLAFNSLVFRGPAS